MDKYQKIAIITGAARMFYAMGGRDIGATVAFDVSGPEGDYSAYYEVNAGSYKLVKQENEPVLKFTNRKQRRAFARGKDRRIKL